MTEKARDLIHGWHGEISNNKVCSPAEQAETDRERDEALAELDAIERSVRASESTAKQLQASMERNARMVNRLKALKDRIDHWQPSHEVYNASDDIERILKEKEI